MDSNSSGQFKIIKILAPLTDNPYSPDDFGLTPIHVATEKGYSRSYCRRIVEILAPLTDNPYSSDT